MLYGALDIASRKTSEKDSHRPLLDEWADVVTDARNLVKDLRLAGREGDIQGRKSDLHLLRLHSRGPELVTPLLWCLDIGTAGAWDRARGRGLWGCARTARGADMSTRADVEYTVEGATIRGWFYTPDASNPPYPTVVVQHGFSAVKEMHLDDYAEVFAAAGLACVVYDHPGFGDSDPVPGTPRLEIDPWQQIRFVSHAITYAQSRDDVNSGRIGLWGSSYGAARRTPTSPPRSTDGSRRSSGRFPSSLGHCRSPSSYASISGPRRRRCSRLIGWPACGA